MGTAAAHSNEMKHHSAPETELLTGRERDADQAAETLRRSDSYASLRSRLDERGYGVTTESAFVTEKTERGTVSVLLPLTADTTLENDLHGIVEEEDESPGEQFAHFLWTDQRPDSGQVVRTGPVDRIVPDKILRTQDFFREGQLVTEFITGERHTVQHFREVTSASDEDSVEQAVDTVDLVAGTVDTQRESDPPVDASDNCPGGIAPWLGLVTTCAAACAVCPASIASGNWELAFTCLGCPQCTCAIACCGGEVGGEEACSYADMIIAIGYPVYGPGQVAAAYCARDGCNGQSCDASPVI